jgi:hypothetical protein
MTGIGSSVRAEPARPMLYKAALALEGAFSGRVHHSKHEPSAVDATTYLLTHKDFRKAMTSLSSFHERAGRA